MIMVLKIAYCRCCHALVGIVASTSGDIFEKESSQSRFSTQQRELKARRTGTSVIFNLNQAAEVSRCKRGWAWASCHAQSKQDCSRHA